MVTEQAIGILFNWLKSFSLRPFLGEGMTELQELVTENFYSGLSLLVAIGYLLFVVGSTYLFVNQLTVSSRTNRVVGLVLTIVGFLLWLGVGLAVRTAMRAVSQRIGMKELGSTKLDAHKEYQLAIRRQEELERKRFERNIRDTFVLRSFQWKDAKTLEDGTYTFAPKINVLLGKNGYGKTLIYRTLAALLQRDLTVAGLLSGARTLEEAESLSYSAQLEVLRNGRIEKVSFREAHFLDEVGSIPLLAIPDSRFVDHSSTTVSASITGTESLAYTGAFHFLQQKPYENVVQEMLTKICLDYLETGSWLNRGARRPMIQMLEKVVRDLSDDKEFFFAGVERVGAIGFKILVKTAGSGEQLLPIQVASQGTLSILAIFGLIYTFLGAEARNTRHRGTEPPCNRPHRRDRRASSS